MPSFDSIFSLKMTAHIGLLSVLYFFYCLTSIKCTVDYDYYLERWEHLNGDKEDLVDFRHINVVRKGRDYVVSGNFSFLVEMDDSFQTGITTAYSSLGNNQFKKYPLNVPKTPICVFFNSTYKKYIEPGVAGHSSFPIMPPEGLCPIPKGTFTANGVYLDDSNIPNHVPRGFWRLESRMYKGKTSCGGFAVYMKVVDKN